MNRNKNILDIIIKTADDKKALDIRVIDLEKFQKEFEKLVIMGGESSPQLTAIAREIEKKLGLKPSSWEGEAKSGWMILDAGGVVVHIMTPAERKYYNLEELWGKEGIVYHY